MTESPLQYPELPPELSAGARWRMLRFFGAGAIIASVTIGSGETLFASRGGALFGYALLWCFVGSAIMKGVQVYTAARYITLTGEHPMTHWGQLPGPRNWVPILIGVLSLICFPFWLAGLPRIMGGMINWMFGLGSASDAEFTRLARMWGTAAILIAVTLTWIQSYNVLERVQTIIVGLLILSVAGSCLASRPDWIAALFGTLIPSVPQYQPWVAKLYPMIAERPPWVEVGVYLGAIGGGTYDYIGYIGCLREKKWGAIGRDLTTDVRPLPIAIDTANVERARRWLLAPKIDTGVSFLCVLLFTVCFVVLGAHVLHPAQVVPAGQALLTPQAEFLTQLHPSLLYVYQVGIFMAFWGTIYGAYELYTRTGYECIRPISKKLRDVPIAKVRRAILLYCGIGGLILMWTFDDPIKLVTPAAIVGGVFTCGLWCFAMIWTDRHFLPKPLRMRAPLLIVTAISGAVLTALGAKGIWDYVAKLVG